jgi:hypothetical protein
MRRLLAAKIPIRVLVLALVLGSAPATPAPTRTMTDDEFIESLGDDANTAPVDRKRLARIFFSLASTLDGGKSSVQLLHGNVVVPDPSRQAVQSLLRTRYEGYTRSLARFKASVTKLLDEPNSLLLFYRALADGQRACWQFDLHNRLIETYGSTGDMLSILSSREACGRLRTAAFQPRVEAILMSALVDQVYQRQEILELQAELKELEALMADLLEIDTSE